MSTQPHRQPLIARHYGRYLRNGSTADFIRSVSETYTLVTLHQVMRHGERMARRGAVLAVTLIGRAESVPWVEQALRDPDRAVRLIAEDGIQGMWNRAGSFPQCQQLQMVMRMNSAGQFADALQLAEEILAENPHFAEAWFQRAEALLANGRYFEAIADFTRVLECESSHFPAALSMAQCYLQLGDLPTAIECLHQTLRIHPHLEFARVQIQRLERELREQTGR